jgi:peptidylprolyl isomerase
MTLARRKPGTQRGGHKDRRRRIAIFRDAEFLHRGQSSDQLGTDNSQDTNGSLRGFELDRRRNTQSVSRRRRMRAFPFASIAAVIVAALAIAAAAIAPTAAMAQAAGAPVTTPSGLKIMDTKLGTGATPRPGQICVMHYTGWLYEGGAKGKKFDSSLDRGQPFEFPLGRRQVISGWDEGVATMKVGGKRTLIIPPELGYGARGAGGVIPPNATLIFDVELLDVKG